VRYQVRPLRLGFPFLGDQYSLGSRIVVEDRSVSVVIQILVPSLSLYADKSQNPLLDRQVVLGTIVFRHFAPVAPENAAGGRLQEHHLRGQVPPGHWVSRECARVGTCSSAIRCLRGNRRCFLSGSSGFSMGASA
jgi:hypothetical protein